MQKKSLMLNLDLGWKFCFGDVKRWEHVEHMVCYNTTKTGHEVGEMDIFLRQNQWIDVSLPHDWNTWQPASPDNIPALGFKPRDIGWYYNEIDIPEYDDDACVMLEFEGVMGECVVYVNGALAARNESGYTPFCFDISDYVLAGQKNMIVVSVDNRRWEGWWYEGAGIYRSVNLHIKPAVHLGHMKTFVRPQLMDGKWNLNISSGIVNTSETTASFDLRAEILDAEKNCVLTLTSSGSADAFSETVCSAEKWIGQVELWSPEQPYLYSAEIELAMNGEIIDREHISFGFRDIQWTDHGMFINGKLTQVHGVCCHQDHVGVGIAVTKSIVRYRIQKLMEMGCNAYRCAHHCPSKYLLEVCDELGMLVMAENRHFRSSEEVMKQVDTLTLLSRNHPSVFLYSLFNEEHWQGELRGRRIAAKLLRRFKMNDDTRPVTAAMNGGILANENASDILDIAGLNYTIGDYMAYAQRRPGHPMLATENGPIYATRGIYKDDAQTQVYNSYGLTNASFGQTLQDTMKAVDAAPHVAGLFIWGGIDYRGEPQPFEWPSVYSHWGLLDNCCFEKDTFYMLKSYYDDPAKLMVHLLPHWNWQNGEDIRVCAMTNCDTVQFWLNDRLIETCKVVDRRAECQVTFEPGVLRVTATKDGVQISDEVRTAGEPAQLEVLDAAPDKDYDSSIINVRLLDAQGIPVPGREADCMIHFEVKNGTIIGVGNGNPNGVQPEIADEIETFCGRCQAVIRPDADGKVCVTVSADNLPPVTIVR